VAVGVAAAATLTFTLTSPGSTQDKPFNNGTGTAVALAYKVNPIFGNLSFGITAGESVAGHQNTGATAQSKAINLGVIGVTLAGEGCNGDDPTLPAESQPQPVIVRSDEPGAAEGKTNSLGGVITMTSRATTQPLAQAITTVAPIGVPNVLEISGGRTDATSGVAKAGVREARAISEIADVNLLGGLVRLKGLRWEAVQTTGATTSNSGSFTLGSIAVAGTNIPLPTDPLAQLSALKDVLTALGITITAPVSHFDQGIMFVEPMTIGIVPSTLRDTLVQTILGGIQDVREQLVALLTELGCNGSADVLGNNGKTAITVLDLALGAVSGAGRLTLELGGVTATTGEIKEFEFGQANGAPLLPGLSTPVVPGLGNLGPNLGNTPANLGGGASAGTETGTARPVVDPEDGERGGILLGVAGGGLALLLLTAEADRRKMRRAQREIFQEA
jgi:hypothetical protein